MLYLSNDLNGLTSIDESCGFCYLFGKRVGWGRIAVTLTINSRVTATANRIHFPLSKIVVNHMDITTSTSWHPLYQFLSKVIKRNGYLKNHTNVPKCYNKVN